MNVKNIHLNYPINVARIGNLFKLGKTKPYLLVRFLKQMFNHIFYTEAVLVTGFHILKRVLQVFHFFRTYQ